MQELFAKQFADLPSITGLLMTRSGSRWIAACYMNGKPHHQKDKTYAVLKSNGIYIKEQGGQDLSLPEFLEQYGNLSNLGKFDPDAVIPEVAQVERIFVDPIHFESTIPAKYSGNLFTFLSQLFSPEKVTEVFHRYGVGENGNEMIFWRMTESGNVCYDSRITYGKDGHRIKEKFAYRLFKKEDGFSGACVFGSHLIGVDSEVCLVESEKTALIMALVEKKGRVWVATGGSNNFNGVGLDWKLLPDFDNAGSFWECHSCELRGSKDCIISVVDGRREKGWGCVNRNPNVVNWFDMVEAEEGNDVGDYVLNNLKMKKYV